MKTVLFVFPLLLSPVFALEPLEITVWNQHNGTARDRGSKTGKVEVFDGPTVVAVQDNVTFEWSPTSDPKTTFTFPNVPRFDRVRVSVSSWHGVGGGLSEVQVSRRGQVVSKRWVAAASVEFDGRFAGSFANDGIASSEKFTKGYWLLPDGVAGWIELSPRAAPPAVPAAAAAAGPNPAIAAGEAKGKFWVSVDDDAVIWQNGLQVFHANAGESSSAEVTLKTGDRLVAFLTDTGGEHRFKIVFVSTDRRTMVSFTNRAFKLFKDPDTRDITAADFAKAPKTAKQEGVRQKERLPFKNASEWIWGDTPSNCVLGGFITQDMFKPMPAQ